MRIVLVLSILIASVSPAAATTPDSASTARLAQQLREAYYARIGVEARTLVLVKPRVASEGLAYESVQTGAIWSETMDRFVSDTTALPPNPCPWERIDQIEAGERSKRPGIIIGGSLGLLTGLAASGLASTKGREAWGYAALIGAAGAGIGAQFPVTKWKHVYPEPPAAGDQPVQVDRVERQLRYARYTRVDIEGRTYELINPRVDSQGIAYERIPGFPKTRPAIVAGADWDSLAMPPNPIPWSRIDRIEEGFPTGSHSTRNGALIGLLVGVAISGIILGTADSYSYAPLAVPGLVVFSPFIGALVGGGMRTTRWEQVYPEPYGKQR